MKTKNISILTVDDSVNDQLLITQAFRENGVTCPINWASSGNEAIAYLMGVGKFSDRNHFAFPSFLMTDLKMSKGDGFSILQHLKRNPEWAVIPTVVFSSSADLDDINRAYLLGAGSYIVKPTSFDEMRECLRIFYDYWMQCETLGTVGSGKRFLADSHTNLGQSLINQDNYSGITNPGRAAVEYAH